MEWEFKKLAESPSSDRLQCREADETYLLATSSCNIHKNRYRDVLPLGFNGSTPTRVRLQSVIGVEGSDYINANHIDIRDKRYIACQAPVPHTFGDFWRMIWEQDVTVIVMLTSLVENDRVKAHAYWPPVEKTHRFGSLSITLLEEAYDGGIMTRKFNITKLDDSSSRQLTQLHFCDWPDHGVPRTCTGIRRIIHLSHFYVRHHQHQQGICGPVVVHCSAGIGRAGTFIAIDLMLDVLHSRKVPLDDGTPKTVFDTVRCLRQRRRGMIQTLEQYKFIFKVLEDYKAVDSNTTGVNSPVSAAGDSTREELESNCVSPPRLLRSSVNILRVTGVNLPHYRSPKESSSSHHSSSPISLSAGGAGISSHSKRNLLTWRNSSPARPVRKQSSTPIPIVSTVTGTTASGAGFLFELS